MLNHKQTVVVLAIGLVAVLMISASTRVFAAVATQNVLQADENKLNNILQTDENKIAAEEHAIDSKITSHETSPVSSAVDASGGFR